MKRLFVRLLIAFLILPAVIGGIFYSLDRNGFFNLKKLQVSIESHQPHDNFFKPLMNEVDEALETQKNRSLWALDLSSIADQLQKMDWIERVHVSRQWPNQLQVLVVPKDVKFLYLGKKGQFLPVTSSGEFLRNVKMEESPDVVLLQGEVFEKNETLRKKAIEVISSIPQDGKFSQKTISELRYNSKEGFWATLIQSGIRVKLGEEQVALKSERVAQVLEYMETRELKARVIDADLSKKVLVRLRKDP